MITRKSVHQPCGLNFFTEFSPRDGRFVPRVVRKNLPLYDLSSSFDHMATDLFIYSNLPLTCGRDVVEDAVDDAISGNGEVTGGGSGDAGWNVDVELFSADDTDAHVAAIVRTLRELPVPNDTYLVFGADQSRVNVYPRDTIVRRSYNMVFTLGLRRDTAVVCSSRPLLVESFVVQASGKSKN